MGKISEYRARLDRTLASAELTNDDALKTLIRKQLQSSTNENEGCSENVIDKKTAEVSYFLDMLRSASVTEHGEWKLKDDNEEYRVMYRQGPHGTPLHTLLVEGYVDGPVDICLCVSWESTLYGKWFPQISFPPFKITTCKCLQKVRIGEQISLVRVKVMWPLSAREAVPHYFIFEYLKDGLIVVLINAISDLDSIDKNTHGFTSDRIPEATDVVRIGLVGGFALQKVTSERSYFRTIATVDLKVDFVPPSFINFISRQIIGSGFRLYQKAVASVSSHDEDYGKALEDPMYARIREALYSLDDRNGTTENPPQDHSRKDVQKSLSDMEQNIQSSDGACESVLENAQVEDEIEFGMIEAKEKHENRHLRDETKDMDQADRVVEILQNPTQARNRKKFGEIVEEESDDSVELENGDKSTGQPLTNTVARRSPVNYKTNVLLSPEVERALATLEKAISLVRERGFSSAATQSPELTGNPQKSVEKDLSSAEDSASSSDTEFSVDITGKGNPVERTSHESRNSSCNHGVSRRKGSDSNTTEVSHDKVAPMPPEQHLSCPSESNQQVLRSSTNGANYVPNTGPMLLDNKQIKIQVNGIHENGLQEKKKSDGKKNHKFCCFGLSSQ